ncbi:rhodanese-like domain-containing protein [Planctomonas psychrotolerans]|uniref:rhodanese-like domain-containing protein n=1 Tax=Planctomonas psychrotolerans TaxID=2528712 RepID=UPI001D0D6F40|nr:rhodanese-like domain-containing protein [Planctomonas psychrotolerans]
MTPMDSAGFGAEIDAATAIARVTPGDSWLLDVREPTEWEAGHAPDAHHVPMGSLQDRLEEIPDDTHVLVICRSGGRSARVTNALLRAGYPATNVVGGMESWQDAGGAVVRNNGTPGIVA